MHRTVADVMTSPAVAVPVTAGFKEIVTRLREGNLSGLAVVDDTGCLVGIVSEGDLILKRGARGA